MYGSTALMCAVEKQNINLVKELIKAGAYLNAIDCNGETALTRAIACENEEITQELLNAGADAPECFRNRKICSKNLPFCLITGLSSKERVS